MRPPRSPTSKALRNVSTKREAAATHPAASSHRPHIWPFMAAAAAVASAIAGKFCESASAWLEPTRTDRLKSTSPDRICLTKPSRVTTWAVGRAQ